MWPVESDCIRCMDHCIAIMIKLITLSFHFNQVAEFNSFLSEVIVQRQLQFLEILFF